MPKPFSLADGWRYDINSIKERPILGAHIGTIAAMWAQVEATLGVILSMLLGADSVVGTAMYASIISEQARSAAMNAAASEKLSAELMIQYSAIMNSIKTPRKSRNKVVHGLWAISDKRQDCLILIDLKKYVRQLSFMQLGFADPRRVDLEKWSEATKDHDASLMEYKEADFIEIEEQILQVMKNLASFMHELFELRLPTTKDFPPTPN